jgi:hypothetical protein
MMFETVALDIGALNDIASHSMPFGPVPDALGSRMNPAPADASVVP